MIIFSHPVHLQNLYEYCDGLMKLEEGNSDVDEEDDAKNPPHFPTREVPEALAVEVGRTILEVTEKNPVNYFAYLMVFTSTLEESVAAFADENMRVAVMSECRHLMISVGSDQNDVFGTFHDGENKEFLLDGPQQLRRDELASAVLRDTFFQMMNTIFFRWALNAQALRSRISMYALKLARITRERTLRVYPDKQKKLVVTRIGVDGRRRAKMEKADELVRLGIISEETREQLFAVAEDHAEDGGIVWETLLCCPINMGCRVSYIA